MPGGTHKGPLHRQGVAIMLLWIIVGAGALAASLALFWPLLRRGTPDALAKDDATLIYARQLAELDEEEAAGRITREEAESIRRETGRRMIAAARSQKHVDHAGPQARPLLFAACAVLAAIVSIGLYLHWGSPEAANQIDRDMARLEGASAEELIAILTRRMVESPGDAQGWKLLAKALAERDRYAEAAQAYARAIAASTDPDARLLGDYGEAATIAEGGTVPPEAIVAFERARALEPMDPRPRLYLAMAQEQFGDVSGAINALESLLDDSAEDAPWRPLVEGQLLRMRGAQSGVDAPDIQSMVDGLAARLNENPNDLDGWLMLIRAYEVLGDTAKAQAARTRAREIFADDADALARISAGSAP